MPQVSEDKIELLPSTTQSTDLRTTTPPTPFELTAEYSNTEILKEPIQHDLRELGDKIQRLLPPVHPAGNLLL